MNINRLGRHSLLLAALIPLLACAAPATPAPDTVESVKKALATRLPKAEVSSVRTTPVKGLYEVVVQGRKILYVDAKVNYLLDGDLVDLNARKSLTEARIEELSRVDAAKLPVQQAIKLVKGNGARVLHVFSDPDCPYCKKLEASLKDINNVTIYTYILPLEDLHPDARRKAGLVWCASNPAEAWQAFMLNNTLPDNDGKCANNPVDANLALAQSLNIHGTPALIFGNGRLVPGAIDSTQIETLLNEASAAARPATKPAAAAKP
jgi:thiol:disulfide interchange protein DsbC